MKELIKKIRHFFSRILTGLLFLAAIAIVYYLFPKQGKFPYEYQKGAPWLHETLIAGFSFPILKSEAEIAAEKDSLLKDHQPYFVLQPDTGKERIEEFTGHFATFWKTFRQELWADSLYSQAQLSHFESTYLIEARHVLDTLYRLGVLPDLSGLPDGLDLNNGVGLVVNKIVEHRKPGEVATVVESYQWVKAQLTDGEKLNILQGEQLTELFERLDFNRFIVSNLVFDPETTEAVKKSMLSNMSTYRGMVMEGQRIISKGDMVTPERTVLLDSFKQAYESQTGDTKARILVRVAQIVLILLCFLALFLFLGQFRREVLHSNLKMTFVLLMMVLVILAGSLAGRSASISLFLVPFAILPVIMRSFFDSRLALFIHLIAMLLVGYLVPNGYEFIFMQMLAGFAGIVTLSHLHRRGQLVLTSFIVFLVYSLIYLSISVLHESSLNGIRWINLAWFAGNAVLLLFSYPLIYIFEKVFGFISDVTLIEISDSNHPLLRKLAEEATGTFQHSMQVANLAESIVRVIGGNPLLVRAGAMYHDIGKSSNSMLFTENQVSGVNPHEELDRKESAGLIINHVIRGAEIARRHKIPKPVVDFIFTHHGTSKTQYFLKMYQKENPGTEINPEDFSYPGPRPFSKETAVLMMCDAVEAASRSLKEYNAEAIKQLIDYIIDGQIADGQFLEAEVTFKDIHQAKEVLHRKLMNIYHARVQYPK